MQKKLQFILISILITSSYLGKSQISQDLRNLAWSNNDKYVIYGHTIQPIFGDVSWTNKTGNPPKTNIAYKSLFQLVNDLKLQANTDKWDSVKLNNEIAKLNKTAKGGRIYVYIDRTTSDLANLRYFFSIVREQDKTFKEKEIEITTIYFKQNEPYIVSGDRFASEISYDINKDVPDSFYVYINDKQTEAMSDYKFKVVTMSKIQKYVSYYENKQIKCEGTIKQDYPIGKWVKYYPNGKVNIIENYTDGKLNGKATEYNENGDLVLEKEFSNGLRNGIWKQYYHKIMIDGRYKNDKKDSIWNFYDTIGNLTATGSYINDLKNGNWTFYINGHKESEGNYTDDLETGEWKIFDNSENVIAQGMLNKGKEVPNSWSYFIGKEKIANPDTNVLFVVDTMPKYRGGDKEYMMFVKNNTNFPPSAIEKKLSGKVFISFIVEPNGTLSNITLLKGLSPEVDAEILRIFSIMPRWIPGIQNGRLVRVKLNMPISIGG